jgi:SSS family solute:Na+ symporter
MILLVLFITISLCSKKIVPNQIIPKASRSLMTKWSHVFGMVSILSILAATVVTIGAILLPAEATPDNSTIAYLNDIGFQAFFFFGFLSGSCALLLFSNAVSTKQDPKALPINLALFSTTKGYTYGAITICLITLLLYIVMW